MHITSILLVVLLGAVNTIMSMESRLQESPPIASGGVQASTAARVRAVSSSPLDVSLQHKTHEVTDILLKAMTGHGYIIDHMRILPDIVDSHDTKLFKTFFFLQYTKACIEKLLDIQNIEKLLGIKGFIINMPDKYDSDRTLLHKLAEKYHSTHDSDVFEALNFLLDKGADRTVRDKEGKLAWFFLTAAQDQDIGERIRPHAPNFDAQAEHVSLADVFLSKSVFAKVQDTIKEMQGIGVDKVFRPLLIVGQRKSGKKLLAKALATDSLLSFFTTESHDTVDYIDGARDIIKKHGKTCLVFLGSLDTWTAAQKDQLVQWLGSKPVAPYEPAVGMVVVATTKAYDKLDLNIRKVFHDLITLKEPNGRQRRLLLDKCLLSYPFVDLGKQFYRKFEKATHDCSLEQLRCALDEFFHETVLVGSTKKIEPLDVKKVCDRMFTVFNFSDEDKEDRSRILREALTNIQLKDNFMWDASLVKELLNKVSDLLSPSIKNEDIIRSILFYGPPGTGKTPLAEALANELVWEFFDAGIEQFRGSLQGDAEKQVIEFFSKAREQQPCVIFIDEVDVLGSRTRPSGDGAIAGILSVLWRQIDKLIRDQEIRCLVVGATNYKDQVDPTMLKRFKMQQEVDILNPQERAKFLKDRLEKKPHTDNVVQERFIQELGEKTNLFSVDALDTLIITALELARGERNEDERSKGVIVLLRPVHLTKALETIKDNIIAQYNGWLKGVKPT